MELIETLTAPPPSLSKGLDGKTWRIGKTRVLLDTVIAAYNQGSSAERIVEKFPTLDLEDVCGVIAYYLSNQVAVDDYVAHRYEEAMLLKEKIQKEFPPAEVRSRLLARKMTMRKGCVS